MKNLTIRLPEDVHKRLKILAGKKKLSINKLFEGLANAILTDFDAEMRFCRLTAEGNVNQALEILDKLDKE